MDKSSANFFRQKVNEKLTTIDKDIVEVKKELFNISIKLDKIIDFLQRKESNRGYILGSWKTEWDEY